MIVPDGLEAALPERLLGDAHRLQALLQADGRRNAVDHVVVEVLPKDALIEGGDLNVGLEEVERLVEIAVGLAGLFGMGLEVVPQFESGVEVAGGQFAAVMDDGAAAADKLHLAAGHGVAAGNLDVGKTSVVGLEDDFEEVVAIPDGDDVADVGPEVDDLATEELEGLVYQVGAPVGEQATIVFGHGHPVVAAAVADGAVQLDVLDIADETGVHQLPDLDERGLKTAVVAEEEFAWMLLGHRKQMLVLGDRGGDGLFDNGDLAGLHDFNGHGNVVGMADANGDHVQPWMLQHRLQAAVLARGFQFLGKFLDKAVRIVVGASDEFELAGEGADLSGVVAADAADADDADVEDFVCHAILLAPVPGDWGYHSGDNGKGGICPPCQGDGVLLCLSDDQSAL